MSNLETPLETVVVTDHHRVFDSWKRFFDADLLHVDAHSDFGDYVKLRYNANSSVTSSRDLNIANFICPAIHLGHLGSVYWLNPEKEDDRRNRFDTVEELRDMGTVHFYPGRPRITTANDNVLRWGRHYSVVKDPIVISPSQIVLRSGKPFILDIDLDAFLCAHTRHVYLSRKSHYMDKLGKTIDLLRGLKRPDLITIARSPGYIDPKFIPEVEIATIEELRKLYGKLDLHFPNYPLSEPFKNPLQTGETLILPHITNENPESKIKMDYNKPEFVIFTKILNELAECKLK